jgi:hypothetical protein
MILLSALGHFHPHTQIKFQQRMVKAYMEALRKEIKWSSEEYWQDLLQKFNPLLPTFWMHFCYWQVRISDPATINRQQPM